MIEDGPLNLEGSGFAGETAIAQEQFQSFGCVSKVKLSAILYRETGCLKRGQGSHFLKELPIIRQERLSDMKTGEVLFLENQDAFSSPGKKSRDGAPPWPTPDHDSIIRHLRHGGESN